LTGVVIGAGVYYAGYSASVGLLSAGLCSMAGMLPDIDSSSSRSFQECIYFAAGLCAVMIVERTRFFGFDHNTIILSGAIAFLFVRFAIGGLVKKLTVHRGMFHSVPAAILAGELVFCLTSGEFGERIVKSFAIVAGYLSHLILDEICSIDHTGRKIKLKQSFGTALKFYDSKHIFTVMILYLLVFFIGAGTIRNTDFMIAAEQSNNEINTDSNSQNNTEQNAVQKQSENNTIRNSIRSLLRYLAGFENKRYSDKNQNGQKFARRKNSDPKNKSTDSTTMPTDSTTQMTMSSTSTMSTLTAAASIPLSPELLKPPENLESQNSDSQIFTQYRRRRNGQSITFQSERLSDEQSGVVKSSSDLLPVIIPSEDNNISDTNYIDGELTPLEIIDQKIPFRQNLILPNRSPAPLNRMN
jgi:hypothetical protein